MLCLEKCAQLKMRQLRILDEVCFGRSVIAPQSANSLPAYVLQVLWVYSTHFYQKSAISSTQDRNFPNIGQWDPEDSARVKTSFIMGGVSPTGLVIVSSNPTIDIIKNNLGSKLGSWGFTRDSAEWVRNIHVNYHC